MMKFAVQPADYHTLEIVGKTELFPVNNIICTGTNYAAHAKEMGSDPKLEPPFFFMKPASAVVPVGKEGATIPYPPKTSNYHHEIELVVALKSGGRNIKKDQALDHIYGYAVGLDMTRRDLQLHARDKGRPWEFGKSFSLSAPIGPIYPVSTIGHPSNASITLEVNGSIRQSSTIDQLIWSVADIIAYLSEYDVLEAGDLIMTGTPAGVGAVVAGDIMRGQIAGLGEIVVAVSK